MSFVYCDYCGGLGYTTVFTSDYSTGGEHQVCPFCFGSGYVFTDDSWIAVHYGD